MSVFVIKFEVNVASSSFDRGLYLGLLLLLLLLFFKSQKHEVAIPNYLKRVFFPRILVCVTCADSPKNIAKQ